MPRTPEDDTIYVRDVVAVALRGWWVIGLTTLLAVGLVSAWMAVVEPKYTATMTIAPTGTNPANNLGALSAVARFAGFDGLAADDVPKYVRFRQTLFSVVLSQRLEERHQVIRQIYEKRWDPSNETWRPPGGTVSRVKALVNPWFGLPPWMDPSPKTLVPYLEEEVGVSEVGETGMLELSYSHKDPAFAVALLTWLHAEADELLREEARQTAKRQVDYASERLASVTVSDYRAMMLSLLAEEEKKLLLIEAAGPYAALVVDPPSVSVSPTFPRPLMFLFVAIVLGGAFGTVLVFAWHAFFAPIPEAAPPKAVAEAPAVAELEQKREVG